MRDADLPYVDAERIGLVGRSVAGGVTYNVLVTKPGLVDAAVVYAPVSSNAVDNFRKWTTPPIRRARSGGPVRRSARCDAGKARRVIPGRTSGGQSW
ncbi:MAG TPA: hypothetical protein VI076_10550 [Actinopolymorphaceae bacterium]